MTTLSIFKIICAFPPWLDASPFVFIGLDADWIGLDWMLIGCFFFCFRPPRNPFPSAFSCQAYFLRCRGSRRSSRWELSPVKQRYNSTITCQPESAHQIQFNIAFFTMGNFSALIVVKPLKLGHTLSGI